MGTPQHGYSTEPPGDMIEALFNTGCAACYEMARGSEFMIALNSEPATPGRRASSTQVIITNDEVATPVSSQYLAESERVANVTLQDQCPIHPVEHLGLAIDDLAYRWTRRALRRRGPADPDRPIACVV